MKFVSNIFLSALFLIGLSIAFVGCQKEEAKFEEPKASNIKVIDYTKTYKIEKGATFVKYGTVYVLQTDGTTVGHTTIKIRNLSWSYCQEWFYEDIKTDAFIGCFDPTISFIPSLYCWSKEADSGDFEGMVSSDSDGINQISGFHLPKVSNILSESDIDQLGNALGTTASIRMKLNLKYEGPRFWNPQFNPGYACFWIDCRNTSYGANIVGGCGVVGVWELPSDRFGLYFTNIPKTQTHVRLVRNITKAQW